MDAKIYFWPQKIYDWTQIKARDGGTVKYRLLSDTIGEGAADFGATARVRPVVTVTINKE